ncbi:uncharacterized protein N7482_010044 [Penicillium canariense]|uniref:Nudix hydrolase domain-containing protein n=1 Tax=Penicillium canariense TaxID=189055 RepID=A0A9W9HPV5_9EURO|nr:uncharacterized protein N7482_010044 [Penicillium canariense]KAJ5153566.1 hypothetical protein N7482_010044 [Penicillium canariense]
MSSVLPNKPPSEPVMALLIQRGRYGLWDESWEGPGGGYELGKDATMKYTALRETKEETGVVVPPEAIFPLVYRGTFEHKGLRMVYYTSVTQLGAKVPVTVT